MIQEALASYLENEKKTRETRERSGKFNPSSFGRCFRNQFLNRLNVTPSNPPDNRTKLVFKCGNLFEEFVYDLIKDKVQARQIKVEIDDVLGYADSLTEDEVQDCKSQHSKSFWYMHDKDFNIEKDKRDNVLQLMFYAIYLKKPFIRLFYVSKDDLCIEEYRVQVTDYWRQEIEKELTELRFYWENSCLPDAEPRTFFNKKTGKSAECNYCNYRDLCKELGGSNWERKNGDKSPD